MDRVDIITGTPGKARIRTQMSAALTDDDIEFALEAFAGAKQQVRKT
jgi:7-keto-8-aminopelargonate synthetase-like enzyme